LKSEKNPCCEFFDVNKDSNDIVKLLQKQPDRYFWERNCSASILSPGWVSSIETVARMIFTPHWNAIDSKPTPNAVEDVANKGLSVDRLTHVSLQYVHEQALLAEEKARDRPAEKPRRLEAVMWLRVERVRSVRVGEQQVFGVFDTALPENKAHADVCTMVIANKQVQRSARESLYQLLEP
jgi:hypothetical protein